MKGAHYYTVVSPEGKVLVDCGLKTSGAACYASYNFGYGDVSTFDKNKVYLYISKNWGKVAGGSYAHSTFTEENITYVINRFVASGFPVSYVNQDEVCYTICLNESDYFNKSHLRVFLDCFRAFWEGGSNCIGFKYLSIPEEIRNQHDFLLLLQICNNLVMMSGGHGLIGGGRGNCRTAEEVVIFLKKQPRNYNNNLGFFWSSTSNKYNTNSMDREGRTKLMSLDVTVKENVDKAVAYCTGSANTI